MPYWLSHFSANVLGLSFLMAVVELLPCPRFAREGTGSLIVHFHVVLHVVFLVVFHFLGVATGSLMVLVGSGCSAGLIMAYLLMPT